MEILGSRALEYVDDNGAPGRVLLTVYQPSEADDAVWKGRFAFGPPIETEIIAVVGIDYIQALIASLHVACGYVLGTKLRDRVQWEGVPNCGLPWHNDGGAAIAPSHVPPMEANPGSLHVLASRMLGYKDDRGVEVGIPLYLFNPVDTGAGSWQCGIAFGAGEGVPVRYGVGSDVIEALLDALAIARAVFDDMAREQIDEDSDLLDCSGFPRKVGRAFWLDSVADQSRS